MQDHRRRHQDLHAESRRAAHARASNSNPDIYPLPVPDSASPIVVPAPSKILARDSTDSPTGTCTDTTSPGCVLPSSTPSVSTSTIIGLSIALPVVAVAVVLFLLHRRTNKKQADEDKRFADKDLDWGTDVASKGKDGEMQYKNSSHKGHGVGMMSIDLGNPYMLPPDVHGSRDSLHSLSRTVTDSHDPYRAVKTPSIRSGFGDNGSKAESQRNLIANGQSMSNSPSPLSREPIPRKAVPNPFASPDSEATENTGFDFGHHDSVTEKSVDVVSANRLSNPNKSLPATPADGGLSPPPRGDSKSPYTPNNNAGPVDPYAFHEVVVPPSPENQPAVPVLHEPAAVRPDMNIENFPYPPPPEPEDKRQTLGLGLNVAGNRLSVLRPLPPDDPEENPEQRANRIRSFYKEYFSDGDARGYNAGGNEYYEDYGDEFLQDGAVFDPDSGQFIVAQAPYAEPVTRRAMTPPPRGPPQKFRGGPRQPGHMSSGSSPGMGGPRTRAFSNASTSRMGFGQQGPRGRAPQRALPPPSALKNLPTPALLKETSFGMTMDFAPPSSFADRAAGRPESPFMEDRPWQQKAIGSPLASAFTELAVVPSPHTLRKSGTFTALDFAPPPRFKDPESMSDAGSVRSGRSNFSQNSARHQQHIRAGAYRVSRLPKGAVGTKFDIMNELKPKLDMVNRP